MSDLTDQTLVDANELWLPCPGFEGFFEISNLGRVKRLAMWRSRDNRRPYRVDELVLTPYQNRTGYLQVLLRAFGSKSKRYVHRLVCEAFNGASPSERHICHHIDHDKSNNRAANLEWLTPSENMKAAHRHYSSDANKGIEAAKITG